MSTKTQLKKFERSLDTLRAITRAFEHSATQKMEVNKREIAALDKYLGEVKQTYVNAKISISRKAEERDRLLRSSVRKPTRQKVVVLITSEPQYYGHLLTYMIDSFIKEMSTGNSDAIIIGKPGKEEYDKRTGSKVKYSYFDFHDEKPNWQVVSTIADILVSYGEVQVLFAKFNSIMSQDVKSHDLAHEVVNVRPGEAKKYLIRPDPVTALTYLEKQIITSQFLQKLYENGLAKSAIRVKILEIGEIAQRLTENMEKFEKFKRKVLRGIANRKLASLYSARGAWESESIFTIYR